MPKMISLMVMMEMISWTKAIGDTKTGGGGENLRCFRQKGGDM